MPIYMSDLKRQASQAMSTRLAQLHVVIADNDPKISGLVKSVLYALGIRHMTLVEDGSAALHAMIEKPADFIICDWQMRPMDGIDLIRHIRTSPDSPNRLLPAIMLTARSGFADVQTARDAGMTEYVIKPFSALSLMSKIVALIENPRSFILTKPYSGPNRRRRGAAPKSTDERRTHGQNNEGCLVITKTQLKTIALGDTPFIIQPDYELKKKIGFNLDFNELLLPEKLEPLQKTIQDSQREFLLWVSQDLAVLQAEVNKLSAGGDAAREVIPHIRHVAFTIKSRAGTFGYSRGSEVAQLLYDFCTDDYRPDNPTHLIVLQKHIDTLYVIFAQHVLGDGGVQGKELMSDLAKLIEKYRY